MSNTPIKGYTSQSTPIKGYTSQSKGALRLVNENKEIEERVLRRIDALGRALAADGDALHIDTHWMAIGEDHIKQAFMAINRAIMNPQRISLPEDAP